MQHFTRDASSNPNPSPFTLPPNHHNLFYCSKNSVIVMPRSQIDDFEKGRIYEAFQSGQSARSIAIRFKRAPSTITRTIRNIESRGHSQSLPRTGRPQTWTSRDQRHIERFVRKYPFWSYTKVQKVLHSRFSVPTIRRILAPLGIKK